LNYPIKFILTVFLLAALVSCATDYKRWPDGGETDRISPEVAEVSVQDGTLNVDRDARIEIVFSEFVDRNSARSAISVSPRSALKRSKIFWYDKSAEVRFKDLDPDQTVIISINPSLKDIQGNPLSGSYSMSFSTGGRIDKKILTGRINGAIDRVDIVNLNYAKVKVNLYKISTDSIDFTRDEPEYSTGLTAGSDFSIRNMSSGEYKLIAFNDLNNDSKPQFETEMMSFSPGVCDLSDADSLNYDLTLGYDDNIPPYIKNTLTYGENIIKIEFSEKIGFNPGTVENVTVNGQSSEFSAFPDNANKSVVWLRTIKLAVNDAVTLSLGNVTDDFGNEIHDRLRTKTHTVSDTVEVSPFRITSRLPADIPSDGTLGITTSDFTNDSLSLGMLRTTDSLFFPLKSGVTRQPYHYGVPLQENNISEGEYELNIQYADSVVAKRKISVTPALGFGSVSGKIEGSSSGSFVLTFKPVKDGEKEAVQAVPGEYQLKMRPGKYICAAFEDKYGSAVFWHEIQKGRTASAVFFEDTVLVRKNWETTDVDFKFKNKLQGR